MRARVNTGNLGGARRGAGRPKGSKTKPKDIDARSKAAAVKKVSAVSKPPAAPPPAPPVDPTSTENHDPFGPTDTDLARYDGSRLNLAESRAAVEALKAKTLELGYREKLGLLVERSSVQAACQMVFSSFAQSMRSMQDEMERTLALSPQVAEAIGEYVDRTMDQLADSLEMFGGAIDTGEDE